MSEQPSSMSSCHPPPCVCGHGVSDLPGRVARCGHVPTLWH